MPKQKTHKATAKRFRITRTGKVVGRHANVGQHLMKRKNASRVRHRRHQALVLVAGDARRIKKLLPYGS